MSLEMLRILGEELKEAEKYSQEEIGDCSDQN